MSEVSARETPGIDSILDLNALPWSLREQLYVRLVPAELLARFGADRVTLRNAAGERVVRISAPDDFRISLDQWFMSWKIFISFSPQTTCRRAAGRPNWSF